MLWNVTDHTLRLLQTIVRDLDLIYRTLRNFFSVLCSRKLTNLKKKEKKKHKKINISQQSNCCVHACITDKSQIRKFTSVKSNSSVVWEEPCTQKCPSLVQVCLKGREGRHMRSIRTHGTTGLHDSRMRAHCMNTCPTVGLWWLLHRNATADMTGRMKSHVYLREIPYMCLWWGVCEAYEVLSIYC